MEHTTIFIIVMAFVSFSLLSWGEYKHMKDKSYQLWQIEAIKAKMAIETLVKITQDPKCNHQSRMHAHNTLNYLGDAE